MSSKDFIKGTERLVNPITVGSIHFIESFNSLLPKSIQKRLMRSSSQKMPSMGFVVEPYSFFLCYEITNPEKASASLPSGFSLVKTRIFHDDTPKYYCILSCFRLHTSVFWGIRTEFYAIAEDEKTGLLSWIILDYDSDTIRFDAKNGLQGPSSKRAVFTTDYTGDVIADIQNTANSRAISFVAHVTNGTMIPLDERLWLEGNLSIGYSNELSDDGPGIFSLKFETGEVQKALRIPLDDIQIDTNTWYSDIIAASPSELVCFPYAQHFLSDSPGVASNLTTKQELEAAVQQVDFDALPVFPEKALFRSFVTSSIISFTITAILVVLLIVKP